MVLKAAQVLAIGERAVGAIPILFACDEAYAPYTAVAIASVYKHATASADVTILTPGLSPATLRRFERIEQQQGHSLGILQVPLDATEQFPENLHWPKSSYLRMAAAEIVDRERVIYLDSDVVVRAPLQELLAVELGECPVAGVADVTVEALARAPELNWLGLPAGDFYISSGVMVMDLARLRKERFLEAAYAAQHSAAAAQFKFGDQCVLNSVLAGRKAALHPRWNIHTSGVPVAAFHYLFVSGTRGIFHFCGLEKPWMERANPALRAIWAEYLALTDYTLDEVRRPHRPGNPALASVVAQAQAAYRDRG